MKQYNKIKTDFILDFYIDELCEFMNVKKNQVKQKVKFRELADVRAIACFLTKKKFPKAKIWDIANFFGQTHSTVLHSIKKIDELKIFNVNIKRTLEYCENLDFEKKILEKNGFTYLGDEIFSQRLNENLYNVYLNESNPEKCCISCLDHFYIDNIDIFDVIIISQNIDNNPLGFLINSLKK